jgi:hypothetical protein
VKRVRVPGVIDLVFIDDGSQMRWLHVHPQVRRSHAHGAGVVRQLLGMAGPAESEAADSASPQGPAKVHRASSQHDAGDDDVRADLRRLINFVTGLDAGADLASTAHHWLSRSLDGDHQSRSGCSIGTSILLESLTAMRAWAAMPSSAAWPTGTAVARSVRVPPLSFRRCTATVAAPFLAEPLTARTTIVLLVKRLLERSADPLAAFLAHGWDGGPAPRAVLELLGIKRPSIPRLLPFVKGRP